MSTASGDFGVAGAVNPMPVVSCAEHAGCRCLGLEGEGDRVRFSGGVGVYPHEEKKKTRKGWGMSGLLSITALSLLMVGCGLSVESARVEGEVGDTTPAVSSTPFTATPFPDWTPEAREVSRVLGPDETFKVIPVEVWRASLVIDDALRYDLLRACYCESRYRTDVVGLAGERGACQVLPQFWGEVPTDLEGQLAQASNIAAAHGMTPWTTRGGCPEWNAK